MVDELSLQILGALSRMAYRKRKQTKRSRRGRGRKQKTRRLSRTRRMRGGALQIDSVSREHEENTIVTVRPDSREVDSMPMTGRLTVMRELLEE